MPVGRLRIVRVITRLNVGGPTRHLRALAEHLDADRFEQIVLHGPRDPDEGADALDLPGEKILVPSLRRAIDPWNDARAARDLGQRIRALSPQIVHTHQGKAGWLGRLAADRQRVPVIVHTYHGHTFEGYHGRVAAWLHRRIELAAARRSTAIICQSPGQADDIERHLGTWVRNRLHVLPPMIETQFLGALRSRRADRERSAVPDGAQILLFPARMASVKQPHLALEVLSEVRRTHPAAVLWILGDGPMRPAVEEAVTNLGLRDYVRWVAPRPDVAELYSAADVTLLTSRAEGTPLALMEAMSQACPVVATAVGGVPDVLAGRCEAVPVQDGAKGLAAAVCRALAKGRLPDVLVEEVRRTHDPRAIAATLANLYESWLARSGRHQSSRSSGPPRRRPEM